MDNASLTNAIKVLSSDNDRKFCRRVYKTESSTYANRLRAMEFAGAQKVMDAGCGFGQWSFELARLNDHVFAFDLSPVRIELCQTLSNEVFPEIRNIDFQIGDLESIPGPDDSFDAVFSYSCIFLADYKKCLREFHRVLKPGGRLYFNTNDLGWYLYNLIDNHNPATDYSPRENAIHAIQNTLSYTGTGALTPGHHLIMPYEDTRRELTDMGFKIIQGGADASINLGAPCELVSFYPEFQHGIRSVYEILCEKI
jgi:SAM-dependent methyltransferase